jgi:putative addiction module component (TIGR02574 family)
MDTGSARIFNDALSLPADTRAELIDTLLESLGASEGDSAADSAMHDEWTAEIRLRLEQIDNGAVHTVPWQDARRALRGRLQR